MQKLKLTSYLKELRTEFNFATLDEKQINKNPFLQFKKWLQEAVAAESLEPNAMTVATSSKAGEVDARIVLLRGINKDGFSFYTNYNSQKGRELKQNKNVCLNFFWPEVQRQVRIRGKIEKVSPKISDTYFHSRPRQSQIAAWASSQSEILSGRNELDIRYEALEMKFKDVVIPRPPHWGGYLVKPSYFEFWQGRTSRLHDRIIYQKSGIKWKLNRLNP